MSRMQTKSLVFTNRPGLAHRDVIQQRTWYECAAVSALNLLKFRGEKWPHASELTRFAFRTQNAYWKQLQTQRRKGIPQGDSVMTALDLFEYVALKTNFLCSLVYIPRTAWDYPGPVLRDALHAGNHLIVGLHWRRSDTGETGEHSVCVIGYNARGWVVLDGDRWDGSDIDLTERAMTEDEYDAFTHEHAAQGHGSIRVLPFCAVFNPPAEPVGLSAFFIAVSREAVATERPALTQGAA